MASPFPGMDPYLEDPNLWSGFHHVFLSSLLEQLSPALRPKYFARVEERVYVAVDDDPAFHLIIPDLRIVHPPSRLNAAPPAGTGQLVIAEPIPVTDALDREVHEHRLEVIDRDDRSIVAVIELLSPSNKVAGSAGRKSFLRKRQEVYATGAHWMEIDLLRAGLRTANLAAARDDPYQAVLSRAGESRRGFLWPIAMRVPLPVIGVPLRMGDRDVALNLQAALERTYEIAAYDMDIDYRREPYSPLPPDDAAWARERINTATK